MCGEAYAVCCDPNDGSPAACQASALGCVCDPLNPTLVCDNTFDVCCDTDGAGLTCHDTANLCLCGNDPAVCTGTFHDCCDKGQGMRCYSGC